MELNTEKDLSFYIAELYYYDRLLYAVLSVLKNMVNWPCVVLYAWLLLTRRPLIGIWLVNIEVHGSESNGYIRHA